MPAENVYPVGDTSSMEEAAILDMAIPVVADINETFCLDPNAVNSVLRREPREFITEWGIHP